MDTCRTQELPTPVVGYYPPTSTKEATLPTTLVWLAAPLIQTQKTFPRHLANRAATPTVATIITEAVSTTIHITIKLVGAVAVEEAQVEHMSHTVTIAKRLVVELIVG